MVIFNSYVSLPWWLPIRNYGISRKKTSEAPWAWPVSSWAPQVPALHAGWASRCLCPGMAQCWEDAPMSKGWWNHGKYGIYWNMTEVRKGCRVVFKYPFTFGFGCINQRDWVLGCHGLVGLWHYERFYQSTSGDFRQKKVGQKATGKIFKNICQQNLWKWCLYLRHPPHKYIKRMWT